MSVEVHSSAVVSPEARLAERVRIEPYAVVGNGVELGRGTTVGSHAQIEGPAIFGEENRIFPHAVLGFEPQDLKYHGEKTKLVVGSRNVFREFSTVHRGTMTGRGETVIGDDNYFMAYAHVAHDNRIGSGTVFANCASLAGHVEVGDHAILSAFCAVHQFVRIGRHAFVGAFAQCRQDVLPFCKTDGADAKTYGINTIGLKRQGFPEGEIESLQKAYRLLVKSKLNTTQALQRIESELSGPSVEELVTFIRESKRGFHR
ncbi:MAG TPA: acyl-ACP--UDP-N-acetylglucosamine O-acyltransferase [Thermoanaerobaculia bacterium]